jgi:hypothetical protein
MITIFGEKISKYIAALDSISPFMPKNTKALFFQIKRNILFLAKFWSKYVVIITLSSGAIPAIAQFTTTSYADVFVGRRNFFRV